MKVKTCPLCDDDCTEHGNKYQCDSCFCLWYQNSDGEFKIEPMPLEVLRAVIR